jgi:PAS domain-containing protein
VLLWAHVFTLPLIAVLRGEGYLHALAEASLPLWFALGAELRALTARWRSASATLGLVVSSATLVHLFDGLIEAHFHFFVMVAVVALYQAWLPFLLALGFVVVHHSVLGWLVPDAVYNHDAGGGAPLLWGVVHGAFILAESVACLVYWRASEHVTGRERDSRIAAEELNRDLADAQRLAGIGSWKWDRATNTVVWSDRLFDLAGADKADFVPSVETLLGLVHEGDRDRVGRLVEAALLTATGLDFECRLRGAGGERLIIHALGSVLADVDGNVVGMRGTVQDITERRRLHDHITELAFKDPLTGLANRRHFLHRLEDAELRSR